MRAGLLRWGAAAALAALLSGCLGTVPGTPPSDPTETRLKVLVVGDSLSDQLAGGLERVATDRFTIVNGGVGGCGIGPGEIEAFGDDTWYPSTCPNWAGDWQALVNRENPVLVVLHTGW